MNIKEIQGRNYYATIRRGLISRTSGVGVFLDKMMEELAELEYAVNNESTDRVAEELADYIVVGLSMAKHYDIDIVEALEKVTIKNENRMD